MKAPSHQPIDYRLRPAKNIERKMLIEAFWRLSEFGRLESYQYVGFGSLFFSDFILMHRILGIKNLVSIERKVEDKERFEENLPFKCIDLKMGESTLVLPDLNWEVRSIIWLDYTDALTQAVLDDIHIVCTRAKIGSILLVTVNASPGSDSENRLEVLRDRVGASKVPNDVNEADLRDSGTATIYGRIMSNEIEEVLNTRSGTAPPGSRFKYEQLFNFRYRDGKPMMTIGGVIFDEGQEDIVAKCGFSSLPFCRGIADNPFEIRTPHLTFREVRYLSGLLPSNSVSSIPSRGIPQDDISSFSEVYRYFPHFAEHESSG